MKPSQLTAMVVREELEFLISSYPNRVGNVVLDPVVDDTSCVYYTDELGQPINVGQEEFGMDPALINFVTPVCIVGQWIESFHPEFKDDDVVREVLANNTTMRHAHIPFPETVKELLKRAQDHQDQGKAWGSIDLDKVESY